MVAFLTNVFHTLETALGRMLRPVRSAKLVLLTWTATRLYEQGKLKEALSVTADALQLARKELGEDHPVTAHNLNSLGVLLQAMGDLAGARPYLEQAVAVRRKVLGQDDPETAASLDNLGSLLFSMGDYPAARPCFEQALSITRKILG